MTYRFQDILRMVIPGLYLITLCFILFVWVGWIDVSEGATILSLIKSSFANTMALILPFIGFVIGYIINVVSSYIERIIYKVPKAKRPSAYVLMGKNKNYHIDNLDQLKVKIRIEEVTNDNANKAFQSAKEELRNDENINVFYAQSILARNLAGCQVLFTILCLICLFINWRLSLWWGIGSFLLCAIMVYNWWRQRCVYAKYVFAAYNILKDQSSTSNEKELIDMDVQPFTPETTTSEACPFIAYYKAKHRIQK